MPLDLIPPIIYLVTSGTTTSKTTPNDPEFIRILKLVKAAVAAEVSLVQIREKRLSARVLYELSFRCAVITGRTSTRLLINDRFDIALGAGAAGVQLTSESMNARVVRKQCGDNFIIGVSTHSLIEAKSAREDGADFVLFGPVFETESKRGFGAPQGIQKLRDVARQLSPFPVIGIGGIANENARQCFQAGATGIAAITLLNDAETLASVVSEVRNMGEV